MRKVTGSFPVYSKRLPRHHKIQNLQCLGKPPRAPSWPRIPSYQPHTAPHPASSYPAALLPFPHALLQWIHKVTFQQDTRVTWMATFAHVYLLILSETQFYDFSYCSVQVEQQIKQILLTKSLLKHSLCSAPRKQKASLTTHLNPAQKQVNLCFPGRISSACISCHHSSHFPMFRKVFFCLEATVLGNTIRGFTFSLFPKD